ncbi:hypothetical protein FACS1894105_14390 [Clostridia bacterium]|nr:hypothetical protein FACS1894105_14390 [Clostridia bacterium]
MNEYDGNNGKMLIPVDTDAELADNLGAFEIIFADYTSTATTFWIQTDILMKLKHWNGAIFKNKTLLNDEDWHRYTIHKKFPSLLKAMAICIGLDINPQKSEELLAFAGYLLSSCHTHQAYHFVLEKYRGRIDLCNDFLIKCGEKPFGTGVKI